jgi:hypothetical protein
MADTRGGQHEDCDVLVLCEADPIVPFRSEVFLWNGGGFFNFPLLDFWPSLLSFGSSAMLTPELEATEEATSLVSMKEG